MTGRQTCDHEWQDDYHRHHDGTWTYHRECLACGLRQDWDYDADQWPDDETAA